MSVTLLLALPRHIAAQLKLSRQTEEIPAACEYDSLEWAFHKVKHACLDINMSEPDKAAMHTAPFALNPFTCTMKF